MSLYINIFKRLRVQMNGAVSQSMREGGIAYGMNYGVSLPTIKSIAREYYPDHSLAADLWRQEVREMRLAAIYVEDPAAVTVEQAELWSGGFLTTEIAQIAAMELLWRGPCATEIATTWFCSDNELQHLAACHIVGKLSDSLSAEQLRSFICTEGNAYMLREIYRAQPSLRPAIDSIKGSVNDLSWQIEYIG